LAGYIDIRDNAVDNIDIDNANTFIEFTFEEAGHYDDASMGIVDPTVEREPFKRIPIIGSDYSPTSEAGLSSQIVPSRM